MNIPIIINELTTNLDSEDKFKHDRSVFNRTSWMILQNQYQLSNNSCQLSLVRYQMLSILVRYQMLSIVTWRLTMGWLLVLLEDVWSLKACYYNLIAQKSHTRMKALYRNWFTSWLRNMGVYLHHRSSENKELLDVICTYLQKVGNFLYQNQ